MSTSPSLLCASARWTIGDSAEVPITAPAASVPRTRNALRVRPPISIASSSGAASFSFFMASPVFMSTGSAGEERLDLLEDLVHRHRLREGSVRDRARQRPAALEAAA